MRERRELFYSGSVQGVGFRYTTARIARRHPVDGFVRNLADGRVQLVVEGDAETLDRFVDEVAAAFEGMVRDVQVERRASSEEFDGFRIRF
jgi:acylphosphatase